MCADDTSLLVKKLGFGSCQLPFHLGTSALCRAINLNSAGVRLESQLVPRRNSDCVW